MANAIIRHIEQIFVGVTKNANILAQPYRYIIAALTNGRRNNEQPYKENSYKIYIFI